MRSEVILCDEVLSGLSAAEIGSMIPLLKRMKMEGTTIIMIEHRLRELFRIANRIIAMNFGQRIFEGDPAEALKDERVTEAYFGKGADIAI
jgi:branched-chain amino acid transport system ATP-binding protein